MVGDTRGLPRWTFGAAIVRHWSDDPVGFVFCASLVAIALLLIVAGATLVSGSIAAGKTLHWIYVWLQLVASIMVTYRTLGEFSMSPAAPIAPLVALALGSVSAAYPVVLMFELNNKSNWQVCHWDEEIEE
jgi:tellurite resistance protein TehA-like permease